jgi:PIN domain nuclease of toxin-antitoxin system
MATLIHLDTHVVVWLYAGQLRLLSKRARALLDEELAWVSPAVRLELAFLHEVGRLLVAGNAVLDELSATIDLRVDGLGFDRVAREATDLPWTRDPFDRLIVGHACARGATLLTKDRTIRANAPGARW